MRDDLIPALKFLSAEELHRQISKLTTGMAVTKGEFEIQIPQCTLQDIEWNHMDQLHRQCVHNTYEKVVRIATGRDFALSLTQWGKWPMMIPVTDIYVAKGLFYQSLSLAGVIFLHSIISMQEVGEDIKLRDEWFIASQRFLRFLHKPLHKKLYKLNERLQGEDQQIRHKRFLLRKKGFSFHSDIPDYLNSNNLGLNTIYPTLATDAFLEISDVNNELSVKHAGGLSFAIKKEHGCYLIWPATCPHEGGPLANGKLCDAQLTCPWHGLRFAAAKLSESNPVSTRYGFEYRLIENKIFVTDIVRVEREARNPGSFKDKM